VGEGAIFGDHQLNRKPAVSAFVHALGPERKRARRALRRRLACDPRAEAADLVDVIVHGQGMLDGTAEPVRLACKEALAISWQSLV